MPKPEKVNWKALTKDELVHVLSNVISKKTEELVLENITRNRRIQKNRGFKCLTCTSTALKLFGEKKS